MKKNLNFTVASQDMPKNAWERGGSRGWGEGLPLWLAELELTYLYIFSIVFLFLTKVVI
tara:strand:- start:96 stop:272 length:177 start_codon:yes stop_codon:yes gene_type:complete